jgi:hypothetical protein
MRGLRGFARRRIAVCQTYAKPVPGVWDLFRRFGADNRLHLGLGCLREPDFPGREAGEDRKS